MAGGRASRVAGSPWVAAARGSGGASRMCRHTGGAPSIAPTPRSPAPCPPPAGRTYRPNVVRVGADVGSGVSAAVRERLVRASRAGAEGQGGGSGGRGEGGRGGWRVSTSRARAAWL